MTVEDPGAGIGYRAEEVEADVDVDVVVVVGEAGEVVVDAEVDVLVPVTETEVTAPDQVLAPEANVDAQAPAAIIPRRIDRTRRTRMRLTRTPRRCTDE